MLQNRNIDHGRSFDWGRTSPDYARYRDIYPPEFYRRILNLGICQKGQSVLDIDTGTGVLPRNLYETGADLTGIDLSEQQIEQAVRLAKSRNMKITFRCASAETSDFPSGAVDAVTACQGFSYFDHEALAPHLARLLRPEGRFAVLYVAWLPGEDPIARRRNSRRGTMPRWPCCKKSPDRCLSCAKPASNRTECQENGGGFGYPEILRRGAKQLDWIAGIQRAVDYVEAHLGEPIDYEAVAKQAYSSSFHFQRVFHILCGFTLGDYIRMRRLSLAGRELASSDSRVIDTALRYGYDTPESFSRAFTRFHGVPPSQAKHGGAALKAFSPLSVKLILSGGAMMDYRIVTEGAFPIICKRKHISGKAELSAAEISPFWQACTEDGTIDALCRYIPENNIFKDCIVGASLGKDARDAEYPYVIGTPYNGMPITDKGLTVETIPAHTYAVFTCVGKMPDAIQELYQKICSQFFPTSEYQPCDGTDFEAYPSADVTNPDYTCEIWVAVEKK